MSAIKLKRTTIYSDVAKNDTYNEQLKKHIPLAHVRVSISLHPFIIPFDVFINREEAFPTISGSYITFNPNTYVCTYTSGTTTANNLYPFASSTSTLSTGGPIFQTTSTPFNLYQPMPIKTLKPVLPYPDWDNLTEEDIKKYAWVGEYLLHKPTGKILHVNKDSLDNILDFVFENILILCSKELILDQDEWNMLKWGKTKQPSKITYNIQCVGEFSLIEETDEKVRILIKL